MSPGPLRFSLLTDVDQLRALAPAWLDLLRRSESDQPMLSPLWLLPWCDVYGSGQLRVGLFHDGERLVGLAPLQRRRHWYRSAIPFARLEPLGSDEHIPDGPYSEYLGLISAPGHRMKIAQAFTWHLLHGDFGHWDELVLPMLPGDATLPVLLREHLARAGLAVELRETGVAPYAPLPASWDEYLQTLSKPNRKFARQTLRDFEAWAGADAQLCHARTAEELDKGRQILQELHAERWRAAGQGGVFAADRFARFHARVMADFLAHDALELSWLTVRGRPVAANYSLRWAGKVQVYQCGRSLGVPEHVRPGIALHLYCLRRAIETGCTEYDFLAGDVRYKRQLAPASRPLLQLRAVRATAREHLRRLAERGVAVLRRLRKRG